MIYKYSTAHAQTSKSFVSHRNYQTRQFYRSNLFPTTSFVQNLREIQKMPKMSINSSNCAVLKVVTAHLPNRFNKHRNLWATMRWPPHCFKFKALPIVRLNIFMWFIEFWLFLNLKIEIEKKFLIPQMKNILEVACERAVMVCCVYFLHLNVCQNHNKVQ